jgi:hypothetical protein
MVVTILRCRARALDDDHRGDIPNSISLTIEKEELTWSSPSSELCLGITFTKANSFTGARLLRRVSEIWRSYTSLVRRKIPHGGFSSSFVHEFERHAVVLSPRNLICDTGFGNPISNERT